MTKEEIIGNGIQVWELLDENTVVVELDDALSAMDKYARQQAILFHRYFTGDKTNSDNDLLVDYELFCKRQFIEKQNQNS